MLENQNQPIDMYNNEYTLLLKEQLQKLGYEICELTSAISVIKDKKVVVFVNHCQIRFYVHSKNLTALHRSIVLKYAAYKQLIFSENHPLQQSAE